MGQMFPSAFSLRSLAFFGDVSSLACLGILPRPYNNIAFIYSLQSPARGNQRMASATTNRPSV